MYYSQNRWNENFKRGINLYTQKVIVEYKMVNVVEYNLESSTPIDFQQVVDFMKMTEGFNPEKDAISFVDFDDEIINIDGIEV